MPAALTSVGVLGAGSWGTALAVLLCHNFGRVELWGRDAQQLRQMAASGRNQTYLPHIRLPDNLHVQPDLAALAAANRHFLLAVPGHAVRHTVDQLYRHCCRQQRDPGAVTLLWGTKGLDPGSGQLVSEVIADIFPPQTCLGALSGPSFAHETAAGLPTALTLACNRPQSAHALALWFRTPTMRIYTGDDLVGIQLGGAIKNVMAIAVGISDGLGYGANARAALITRGLAELSRLGTALGGKAETFMGLAGVGDLILTCTDDQSRNRRFGLDLGRGKTAAQSRAGIGQEIAGLDTVRQLYEKSRRLAVEMPITQQVYRILYHRQRVDQAVKNLLARSLKAEHR